MSGGRFVASEVTHLCRVWHSTLLTQSFLSIMVFLHCFCSSLTLRQIYQKNDFICDLELLTSETIAPVYDVGSGRPSGCESNTTRFPFHMTPATVLPTLLFPALFYFSTWTRAQDRWQQTPWPVHNWSHNKERQQLKNKSVIIVSWLMFSNIQKNQSNYKTMFPQQNVLLT